MPINSGGFYQKFSLKRNNFVNEELTLVKYPDVCFPRYTHYAPTLHIVHLQLVLSHMKSDMEKCNIENSLIMLQYLKRFLNYSRRSQLFRSPSIMYLSFSYFCFVFCPNIVHLLYLCGLGQECDQQKCKRSN